MDDLLRKLEVMNLRELVAFWKERFGDEAPKTRAIDLLRRRIGWRLQEEHYGGLSTKTSRRLRELASEFEKDSEYKPTIRPRMQTGMVLSREWKGQVYTVEVKPDGYIYNGQHYKGLSKIARDITGTRWSGPLFFGLRKASTKAGGPS